MNYEKLIKIAKEKDIKEIEIYEVSKKSSSLTFYHGKPEKNEIANVTGVSITGIVDGRLGTISSERLEEDYLIEKLDNLKENALLQEKDEEQDFYEGDKVYPEVKTFYKGEREATTKEKIEFLEEVDRTIRKNQDINDIASLELIEEEEVVKLINTKGLNLERKVNHIFSYGYAQGLKEGEVVTGMEWELFQTLKDVNPQKLGERVVEDTVSQFKGDSIKSGEYKVVLKSSEVSSILEAMSSSFSAEKVQNGLSKLEGKLGEKMFSDKLTLVDDPLLDFGPGSTPFDDEGVATERTILIEKGEVKSFLHNRKTAKKDGVKSTGNGFKNGVRGKLNVRKTNLIVKKGETSFEGLLELVQDGIYITELAGLHSGLNPITGEFSLQANGFLIKDGKKGTPVKLITVAGDFFKVFKDIEEVGSDFRMNYTGIGSPSIFIKSMVIAGK